MARKAPAPRIVPPRWRPRFRLLPAITLLMAALLGVKLTDAATGSARFRAISHSVIATALAAVNPQQNPGAAGSPQSTSPTPALAAATSAGGAPSNGTPTTTPAMPMNGMRPLASQPSTEAPDPEMLAERSLLEKLGVRRAELDAREQALAQREIVLAAAERRLTQRIEEMSALQQRLESTDKTRDQREQVGWSRLVKVYESMKPREAAAIFDDLDLDVLVRVASGMREAKAAPVIGAMKPERARQLTAELARLRSRPANE